MAKKYQIRNMAKDELAIAIYWAAQEKWNPGLYDLEAFYATDPRGFFVGLLNNKPIATVSAVRYGNKYSFMGFYIVKPEFRGKGYGFKLFQHAWKYLGKRNIGGDGVLENLEKYAKVGLKLEHYNARYEGITEGKIHKDKNIISLNDFSFTKLAKYDTNVFGFERPEFLKNWIDQPDTIALGFVANNKLCGYGVVRKCYEGYKVAPIFADNSEVADKLLTHLTASAVPGEHFYLDIPKTNKEAVRLVKNRKMKKFFATGRIYTKGQPNFPLDKWYGITSFELG